MSTLSTTRLSTKGQLVIPEDVRKKMNLHTGDQFVVVAEKDVMILKTITKPSMTTFSGLIKKARKQAKEAGLTKNVVKEAINEARRK